MQYPTLQALDTYRETVEVFKGYNRNLRIGDGEFSDMKNMTSDYAPALSPRAPRGIPVENIDPQGMIAKDALCYIDGADFVINEYRVGMGLSTKEADCPKQLISMGAYVIIMPDKKYINTMDLTQFGDIEAVFTAQDDVKFELCTADGSGYGDVTVSDTEPGSPEDLALWIDTSEVPHTLKRYAASSGMWVAIATTYVRVSSPGIGAKFSQYDGVTISGIEDEGLQALCGAAVIQERAADYIVLTGIIDRSMTQKGGVTVARTMPLMDFVIESGNRLWGCRYGEAANGQIVNEIYASKLGDFKNWSCYMSLSTDSYTASVGTDGQFTGAITHLGYPLFFKENCVHKVYGSYPANFQIQTTACRGVQKGCGGSLAIVNEVLYYKSRSGVCAYDGSLPVEISSALGEERYTAAAAGGHGNKYYISMADMTGGYHLFVYDTAKGMWHAEDDLHAEAFCSCRDTLYCITGGKLLALLGGAQKDQTPVEWMVQTGQIGITTPDMKYVSRLTVRMSAAVGTAVRFLARYDFSTEWEQVYEMTGMELRSFSVPIRPKRCDHMQLRIEGAGDAKIYSITKTIEQGSELR